MLRQKGGHGDVTAASSASLRLLVALAVLTPPTASTIADTTIPLPPAPSEELNTVLIHATFLIVGPSNKVPNMAATATVFIIGVPHKNEPKIASILLVTAAHVLEDIAGDKATLLLRRKNDNGTYRPLPFELAIRDHGRPWYVKHATADVVAMYADLRTKSRSPACRRSRS